MYIYNDNRCGHIFDYHYAQICPHCQNESNLTAISFPRYELLVRYRLKQAGIVYKCDSCLGLIFYKFDIFYHLANSRIYYDETNPIIETRSIENFEYKYLPEPVRAEFQEAAVCYSASAFNGFAALCRRTIQSIEVNLGAEGKDKVERQLKDLQDMKSIDEETFKVFRKITIDGHDDAHPYLPFLSPERAEILLELMKDVLYQIYVRKAELEESVRLR